MRNTLIILINFILLTLSVAHAASCTPVKFKVENNTIILPGPQQPHTSLVYFFNNKSLQSVFIDRAGKRAGASAGWSSYLRPGNWSALVLNQKNLPVSCTMITPGKVVTLDCSRTLYVCTPEHLTSSRTPLSGNAWLAEDQPWNSFVKTLEKRGVKF